MKLMPTNPMSRMEILELEFLTGTLRDALILEWARSGPDSPQTLRLARLYESHRAQLMAGWAVAA